MTEFFVGVMLIIVGGVSILFSTQVFVWDLEEKIWIIGKFSFLLTLFCLTNSYGMFILGVIVCIGGV